MSSLKTVQARDLVRRLGMGLAAMLLAYTAAFAVLALAAEATIVPRLGNAVAEATSHWIIMDAEGYRDFVKETEGDGSRWDVWQTDDGGFAVRNLDTYDKVRALKVPFALLVYAAGCIAVFAVVLRRSIGYFDTLAQAIGGLMRSADVPVELPDDLSVVRAELMEVRERALADDRAAKAAEQRKNDLVAYLAHDIKTPLTSVVGYLTLLDENPDLPRATRERYARMALEKAERLDGLVDEFFEITRYNLKSMPIERESIDIRMLCSQVADELFPDAAARDVDIRVECDAPVSAFVDPDKMARALSNVVRNAVAYAQAGSTVAVRVGLADGGRARIEVENRGREISQAHLEAIFEKFFREDGARATRKGGAGLGLAIAKEIVAAHGGTIAASSESGVTVFALEFPA